MSINKKYLINLWLRHCDVQKEICFFNYPFIIIR